ncbi:MAG: hypothetical protein AAFU54_28280 [Chloroflexota bacterium]
MTVELNLQRLGQLRAFSTAFSSFTELTPTQYESQFEQPVHFAKMVVIIGKAVTMSSFYTANID